MAEGGGGWPLLDRLSPELALLSFPRAAQPAGGHRARLPPQQQGDGVPLPCGLLQLIPLLPGHRWPSGLLSLTPTPSCSAIYQRFSGEAPLSSSVLLLPTSLSTDSLRASGPREAGVPVEGLPL